MTTLTQTLKEKQTVAEGLYTQAKGVAREQWGTLTHDAAAIRTGKREQKLGRLQMRYGNHWAAQRRRWLLAGTAVSVLFVVMSLFFARQRRK